MTCLPEDLRTFIIGTTAVTSLVSTRVHYNHITESVAKPHVWFRVSADTEERTMDGVGGLHEASVDVECAGLTETSAQNVADAIKTRLDGYKGTLGNATAQACFLRDKDDDYLPFSNLSDEGVHVVSYSLQMWYTT
jgi:hypothetical protein